MDGTRGDLKFPEDLLNQSYNVEYVYAVRDRKSGKYATNMHSSKFWTMLKYAVRKMRSKNTYIFSDGDYVIVKYRLVLVDIIEDCDELEWK